MSSILKALKKLEEEKYVRRDGKVDVVKGMLRSTPRHNGRPRWVLPVSIAGSACVAAIVTYLVMGAPSDRLRGSDPANPLQAAYDDDNGKDSLLKPLPEKKTEAFRPMNEPSVAEAPKAVSRKKAVPPVAAPNRATRTSSRMPEIPVKPQPSARERLPADNPGIPASDPDKTAQPSGTRQMPVLAVSGIAWQKDGSDRLAVVNGISVTEGMVVGGAVVEKIFQDKVRFSHGMRTFDVPVGR
jgi:general secretion pathway protein B